MKYSMANLVAEFAADLKKMGLMACEVLGLSESSMECETLYRDLSSASVTAKIRSHKYRAEYN